MNVENTKAQMRKGVLEYCILSILAQGELYPSDIISKLKDAKLIVVEGTLYPLLTRLKDAGFQAFLVGGCVRDQARHGSITSSPPWATNS